MNAETTVEIPHLDGGLSPETSPLLARRCETAGPAMLRAAVVSTMTIGRLR